MKKALPCIIIFIFIVMLSLKQCKKRQHNSLYIVENIDTNENNADTLYIPSFDDNNAGIKNDSLQLMKSDPSFGMSRLLSEKPEQLLSRVGYTTSYNQSTKNPNWVAWHLTKEHTYGQWSRDGIPYMVDKEVKGKRQELEDWDNLTIPVDHGHLCPAGDNKWNKKAMEQTFLLTNMCPQNSELNRGDWEKLESKCRGWANLYGDIYIVAGPIFYSNKYKTIGPNKVGVPDAFFKVVLCLKRKPKALGFVYPNLGLHHNMKDYVKTVDEVEDITSIDFFYNLPDEIENKIESEVNFNKW